MLKFQSTVKKFELAKIRIWLDILCQIRQKVYTRLVLVESKQHNDEPEALPSPHMTLNTGNLISLLPSYSRHGIKQLPIR